MKPQRTFVADRVAARHCPELLGGGTPTPAELASALMLLGERLAHALGPGLARLAGADAPTIHPAPPRTASLAQLGAEAPRLASYSLLGIGPERQPVLLTLAAAPVLRLVDRAFGGRGQIPDPLPDAFPLSADLMVQRLEKTIAEALAEALDAGARRAIVPAARDTSLSRLAPFPPEEPVLELTVAVIEPTGEPWTLSLVFPQATLAALLAGRDRRSAAPAPPPDPGQEPFASLPVCVTAVLVDMAICFSRLASLRPGDVLPVAVARSIPLKAGGRTIASGTIGEFEDRVAVQLTSAF